MDTADNRLNVELHARDDPARALQERHQDWLIGPERCRKGNPPTASGQIGVEQALYSFCSVARGRTLRDLEKQWSPATRVPTCGSTSIGPFRLAGALNPVIFSYAGRKDFCASASVTSFRPRIQTSEQNCSLSHRLCGFSDTSSPSYLSIPQLRIGNYVPLVRPVHDSRELNLSILDVHVQRSTFVNH